MRLEIGRMLVTTVASLALAATSACGEATPDTSAGPSPSAGPTSSAATIDAGTACDTVMAARKTALDALAPVAASLAQANPSAGTVARASQDLKETFAAMHVGVAAAAEQANESQLKNKLTDYQYAIEQAIVAVEGADDDPVRLASAITLPELTSAENAVVTACG